MKWLERVVCLIVAEDKIDGKVICGNMKMKNVLRMLDSNVELE
jgi:hypothetical protein